MTIAVGTTTVWWEVWGDFNDLGWHKKDHLTVGVDYHVLVKGERVRVRDGDGNSMDGTVVRVWRTAWMQPGRSLAEVKCDRATWRSEPQP
jgi:hypothetical protein